MARQSWKIGCVYKTPFRKFGHICWIGNTHAQVAQHEFIMSHTMAFVVSTKNYFIKTQAGLPYQCIPIYSYMIFLICASVYIYRTQSIRMCSQSTFPVHSYCYHKPGKIRWAKLSRIPPNVVFHGKTFAVSYVYNT